MGNKGPEWKSLLFAHLLTLNNRRPIGCVDFTLGDFCEQKPFDVAKILLVWLHNRVASSQTPKPSKMASVQLLFNCY